MEQPRAICVLPWTRTEVCESLWSSQQRAATHLEISVHNIMLVDMIDTLQDLTNAMAKRKKKKGGGGTKCVIHCPSLQNTSHTVNFIMMSVRLQNLCTSSKHLVIMKKYSR